MRCPALRSGGHLLTAAALLIAALAMPAGAELAIEAEVGFDGFYIPGEWTPIQIRLSNMPAAFDRRPPQDLVGVVTAVSLSRRSRRHIYSTQVELPANSRKRLWLTAKIADMDSTGAFPAIDVEFRATNRRARATATVRGQAAPAGAALVLIVRDPGQPLSLRLPGISASQSFAVATVAHLPDHWAALSSVAAIFVTRSAALNMGQDEVESLRLWIEQGGSLVVDGAAGSALATVPIAALLPVETSERQMWALGSGNRFEPVAEGTTPLPDDSVVLLAARPRADAEVLWEQSEEQVLVAQRMLGLGQVSFVAWDLSNATMAANARAERIIAGLVPSPASMIRHSRLHQIMLEGIDPDPGVTPPPVLLVLLLLLSYWVVVGPWNHLFLSRRKRIESSWFTIPAIIAAFCLLFYAIGYLTRSNEDTLRHINIALARPGIPITRTDAISLHFSATKQRVSYSPGRPESALGQISFWEAPTHGFQWMTGGFRPGRGFGRAPQPGFGMSTGRLSGLGNEGDPASVSQGRWGMRLDDQLLRQWTFAYIESLGPADLGGTLDATCHYFFDPASRHFGLRATITNNTDKALTHCALLWGDLSAPLIPGDIAPGEIVSFDGLWRQDKENAGGPIRREDFEHAIDAGDATHIRLASLRSIFLDGVEIDWLNPRTGQPHLVAFTDQPLLAPEPDRDVERELDYTMILLELPLEVPAASPYLLSSPCLPVTHTVQAAGDDDVRIGGGWDQPLRLEMRDADLLVTYSLPWSRSAQSVAGAVTVDIDFEDSPTQHVRLFALDRVGADGPALIEVPVRVPDGITPAGSPDPGAHRLDPGRVVDPATGEITLLVRAAPKDPGTRNVIQQHCSIRRLSLTVEGRVRPTGASQAHAPGEESDT